MKQRPSILSLLLVILTIAWLGPTWTSCNNLAELPDKAVREIHIQDFLLQLSYQHKILVIPECLSHDSYDEIRLPLSLIERWTQDDHNIKKLFVGLETDANNYEFELIRNNQYYRYKRFATFCPGAWGLFSTKRLNEYYEEVLEQFPERFHVFGFENNPDACFIIIVGNAHTLKTFGETDIDRQIIDAYSIDADKYWHWLGYFLKQNYNPLFIQSNIDTTIAKETLFRFDPADPDTLRHKLFGSFYTDYIYSLPKRRDTNVEEQPIVCVPSATNFNLLRLQPWIANARRTSRAGFKT
jgi:hypothetical protein